MRRTRLRVDAVLASLSAFLLVLTLVVPDWIEVVFRVDPDGGSGELEWLLAVVPGALSIAFGVLAYRTRRLLAHVQVDQQPR